MHCKRAMAMGLVSLVAVSLSTGPSLADSVSLMSGPVAPPPGVALTRPTTRSGGDAQTSDTVKGESPATGALVAGAAAPIVTPGQKNGQANPLRPAIKLGNGNFVKRAPAAPGAPGPGNAAGVREQQRRAVQGQETYMHGLPLLNDKQYKQDEVVHLKLVDGRLHAELLQGLPNSQVRITVAGSNSLWVGSSQPNFQAHICSIQRYDFDQLDDNQYYLTTISIYPNGINLQMNGIGRNASLQASAERVLLYVMETDKESGQAKQKVMINEPSLQELRSKHPQEVRQYLVPIMMRLCGENPLSPGAADIYGALTELQPDGAATEAIKRLLPRLDADAISERDAATMDLQKLGRPAVLAAMRMDQSGLSEEQKARLQAFISSQRTNAEMDDKRAATDPDFLIDCLDDADASVRQAARLHLQQVIGRELKWDDQLSGEARQAALDKLRDEIHKEFPAKPTPPDLSAPKPPARDGPALTH